MVAKRKTSGGQNATFDPPGKFPGGQVI